MYDKAGRDWYLQKYLYIGIPINGLLQVIPELKSYIFKLAEEERNE
jgi:hypothetical protein